MLVNDHTHPTAEVIYSHVRRIIPDISLGTVYRNLNVLVENGYIRKLNIDISTSGIPISFLEVNSSSILNNPLPNALSEIFSNPILLN